MIFIGQTCWLNLVCESDTFFENDNSNIIDSGGLIPTLINMNLPLGTLEVLGKKI